MHCVSHHTFTCAKARLSTRVCLAICSYHSRSRKWRDAPSNGIHLPKWRLFRRCHFHRVVRRDTLSQCWPRSMMPPGCLTLRGCEFYDKSPFPKIDSPLAFHPPIALPSNIAFRIVSSEHSFTTCPSNLSPRGHPTQNRSDPAWAQ